VQQHISGHPGRASPGAGASSAGSSRLQCLQSLSLRKIEVPYRVYYLYGVVGLMRCFRQPSSVGNQLPCTLRIPMIYASLNRNCIVVRPHGCAEPSKIFSRFRCTSKGLELTIGDSSSEHPRSPGSNNKGQSETLPSILLKLSISCLVSQREELHFGSHHRIAIHDS
jgi:hypothetical protein